MVVTKHVRVHQGDVDSRLVGQPLQTAGRRVPVHPDAVDVAEDRLGLTLGFEGRRRAATEGKRRYALAAIITGAVAVAVGAGIWLLA
jgi:hypothetical protein